MTPTLTFIGPGNMSACIIGGLVNEGYSPNLITASGPTQTTLDSLEQKFGINTLTNNIEASQDCDILVLAVKPQILKQVAISLQHVLSAREQLPLIISVAAGIRTTQIQSWLKQESISIVRCMPNTPSLIGKGACGLYANDCVNHEQKTIVETILSPTGYSTWVNDESLIDVIGAVSGSGPAYFYLFMEAMIDAGIRQGLDRESATQLTLKTAVGAAALAEMGDTSVVELRRQVTSPQGSTERGIMHYEKSGLRTIIDEAIQCCADRSREMSTHFDG